MGQEEGMTENDRAEFMKGLSTPKEQLMDGSVDTLLKGYRKRRNNPMRVQVIPTSNLYRENYEKIEWAK